MFSEGDKQINAAQESFRVRPTEVWLVLTSTPGVIQPKFVQPSDQVEEAPSRAPVR